MLDPVVHKEHCAKDSFSFSKEIKEVSSSDKVLISYVCSLFTSIPLNETIDIAVNLVFDNNPNINITKKELKTLFEFATSGTHIFFDGNFYDQIDGVALGSPLGPVLANLFMGFHEKQWLSDFTLYRRYVDDIICLFYCENDAIKFFDFLNTRHPNIKFTFEKQVDGKLGFLDILLSTTQDKFSTSVFRKKTSIGLYTNFTSFTQFSYKIGLIKTLTHRAFEICSSWSLFDQECNKIKTLLLKEIKKYLNKKLTDNTIENRDNKIVCYYKLPFIGSYSNNTKKKISELCKRFCKQTNIKVVFSPFKICDLFSAKDSLPNALKSYVVYKFTCAGCQSCYVSETKRHLPARLKEHLETDSKSHIFQHLKDNPSCRDVCDTSCFKIIDHASSPFRLKVKEALHIQWLKPVLNKQQKHVSITTSI